MANLERKYHITLDRNGTEDEFAIRTPKGREMAVIWFWDDSKTGTKRARKDAFRIVNALNLVRSVRKPLAGRNDLKVASVIEASPQLYLALEKCELALIDIFARYQQDGDEPSEFEKHAKDEAYKALCLARGEVAF